MNLFNELSLSTSGLTKGRMVASNKTYAFDLFVEDFSFKVASTTSLSGLSNFVFKIGIVNASNVVTYLTSSISYTNVVADQTITVNLNQTLPAGSRFLWIGNGQNAIKYTSNNGIYGHDIKIYDISLLNVNDTITWAATDTNSLVGFNYTGYIVDNVINPLHNKIINGIGDSLMGNNVEGYENSWLAYIGKRNNMIYNNYGISGNKITGAGGVASRYMNMVDNDDYVVVNGLTNDASASVAFGDVTSTDINEVNGALNILITGLLAKYPTAKILFVTPDSSRSIHEPYVNAMVERCAYYGVSCLNLYTTDIIIWSDTHSTTLLTRGGGDIHTNALGNSYRSFEIEKILITL